MDRREFIKTAGLLAGGLLLGRRGLAQTPPGQSGDPLFSFVVASDPHLREDRAGEATGVAKFQRVLAALGKLRPAPEFMLLLGDIHPEKLAPLLPRISLPIYPVHGNHENLDHRRQLREMFPRAFGGQDFYAFTHHNCRFIGLCTALVGDHVGHFESQDIKPPIGQIGWLRQQLAESRRLTHRFIFTHVPPEPNDKPSVMCLGSRESLFFHGLLRHEPVAACFFGHLHFPAQRVVAGCQVYNCASCNWNSGGNPVGFRRVLVYADHVASDFIATVS